MGLGGVKVPFFMRTSDTLVSLIWLDGVLIPTGMVAVYAGSVGSGCGRRAGVGRTI